MLPCRNIGQYSILNMDPMSLKYKLVSIYDASSGVMTEVARTIWPGDCSNVVYGQMKEKLGGLLKILNQ